MTNPNALARLSIVQTTSHTEHLAGHGPIVLTYLERPYTIIDRPLWWHTRGLSQTSSGYGGKPTSARCVRFPDGRERRIYVTCYSNSGTAWIMLNGLRTIVRD